jgi:hypothetical protein
MCGTVQAKEKIKKPWCTFLAFVPQGYTPDTMCYAMVNSFPSRLVRAALVKSKLVVPRNDGGTTTSRRGNIRYSKKND